MAFENDEEKTTIRNKSLPRDNYIPKAYIIDLEIDQKILINKKKYIIGKSSSCDYAVSDPIVSRIHCSITDTGKNFILEDLHSTNGTYVNNIKINKIILKNGDTFFLGEHPFKFITIE